jgi:hypothetical protein
MSPVLAWTTWHYNPEKHTLQMNPYTDVQNFETTIFKVKQTMRSEWKTFEWAVLYVWLQILVM